MARELLGMATDPDLPPNVKLAAVKDALDRANVSGKSEVEVSVTTPLFEQILGGLRSKSRSARGEVDDVDPALSWVQEELTAQVVDDADEYEHTSARAVQPDTEELDVIDAETVEVLPAQPNTGGLQSLEDALATLQEAQPPTAHTAPK
ncbi:hypothetical protein HH308_15080 [Gordonia sp. TBRC 11910]|uniref:Uncharacterized protein n=1 Tax=Gordonia asplenii TaxID=2725283 RepID=A0A848KWU0_9ACTN|nr:hypothetical protein [Gordonia asplenii]NMO02537.1 hypothetical protein [Gordonia asplenii]